jgi:hypothetical protein
MPLIGTWSTGFTGSELATVSVPTLMPEAAGVNATSIVQLVSTGSTAPQLFATNAKSEAFAPLIAMGSETSNGESPLLVSTRDCGALVVATTCPPKTRGTGIMLATGAIPVPLNVTLCVVTVELSVTVRVADRDPRAIGLKVTDIVQLPPAATLAPQVLVCTKSAALVPARAIELIVRGARPLLDSVTVCAMLAVFTN